jgi:PilZ domain
MTPVDHSNAPRRAAAEVPSITGLRLSPHGTEAALVNISETGLLAECRIRLMIGSRVQVLFEGGFTPTSSAGCVARCEVAAMGRDGALLYHIGIEFDAVIALGPPAMPPAPVDAVPEADMPLPVPPVVEPQIVHNRW